MAEKEEKKYIVASPIIYNKKRYEIGEPVDMEVDLGDPLIDKEILREAEPAPQIKEGAKTQENTKVPDILDRDK